MNLNSKETQALITERLQSFKPIQLAIIDDSHLHIGHEGSKKGGHFTIMIQSELFKDLTVLQSHRLVYNALSDLINQGIHALSIKTSV